MFVRLGRDAEPSVQLAAPRVILQPVLLVVVLAVVRTESFCGTTVGWLSEALNSHDRRPLV